MDGEEDVYCVERFKQKLPENYGNKLYLAELDCASIVVCFGDMFDCFPNQLWQKKRKKRIHNCTRILAGARHFLSPFRFKA